MSPRTGLAGLSAAHLASGITLLVLLALPLAASEFVMVQIAAYALILGTLSLSLLVLLGYGGMATLAQASVAGVAGYVVAILGSNGTGVHGYGWPWWLYVPVGILLSGFVAVLIGWLAIRTAGIYTLMITLAVAVALYYLALQNYDVFNGFTGFNGVKPPTVFNVYWRDAVPFYYLCLAVALACYAGVVYAVRTPFGLSLQASRDSARRLAAMGFNVLQHRLLAHFLAGLIAGAAGVLLVWFNGQIGPTSIGVDAAINVLVIAVIGGIANPIGAFAGALFFALMQNFAIDLIDRERFNTVIGATFLVIVLVSPDGLLGLARRFSRTAGAKPTSSKNTSRSAPP